MVAPYSPNSFVGFRTTHMSCERVLVGLSATAPPPHSRLKLGQEAQAVVLPRARPCFSFLRFARSCCTARRNRVAYCHPCVFPEGLWQPRPSWTQIVTGYCLQAYPMEGVYGDEAALLYRRACLERGRNRGWQNTNTRKMTTPTQHSRQKADEHETQDHNTHGRGKRDSSIAVDNVTSSVLLLESMRHINIPNTQGHTTHEQG